MIVECHSEVINTNLKLVLKFLNLLHRGPGDQCHISTINPTVFKSLFPFSDLQKWVVSQETLVLHQYVFHLKRLSRLQIKSGATYNPYPHSLDHFLKLYLDCKMRLLSFAKVASDWHSEILKWSSVWGPWWVLRLCLCQRSVYFPLCNRWRQWWRSATWQSSHASAFKEVWQSVDGSRYANCM